MPSGAHGQRHLAGGKVPRDADVLTVDEDCRINRVELEADAAGVFVRTRSAGAVGAIASIPWRDTDTGRVAGSVVADTEIIEAVRVVVSPRVRHRISDINPEADAELRMKRVVRTREVRMPAVIP